MFPKLELHLRGLDPKGQYGIFMYMEKIDNNRWFGNIFNTKFGTFSQI